MIKWLLGIVLIVSALILIPDWGIALDRNARIRKKNDMLMRIIVVIVWSILILAGILSVDAVRQRRPDAQMTEGNLLEVE